MPDVTVCRRCGHPIVEGAHYCAQCGLARNPFRIRFIRKAERLLDNLSPPHLVLVGLIALIPVGLFTNHLLVNIGLYLPPSLILLALVTGIGGLCLGWVWIGSLSYRSRLLRILFIILMMGLLMLLIWQVDRAFLSIVANSKHVIVSNIPGVHLEASDGYKRWHSVYNPPQYWLIAIGFILFMAAISGLIRRVLEKHPKREATA